MKQSMRQIARQQGTREPPRQEPRPGRTMALWVGLSIAAHVLALLYIGVLSRACGPAAPTKRPTRFVEVTLDTQTDGPSGRSTRPVDEARPRRGVPDGSGPTRTAPPARKSHAKTMTSSKRSSKPSKPLVVAAKPPPSAPEPPKTTGHPTPRKGESLLDMRGARPHRTNTHRLREWERWQDMDPDLAVQLRYGMLPRLSHLHPSQTALAAIFPPDKPVERVIVTKEVSLTAYRDGGRLLRNRTGRNVEIPPRPGRQPTTPGHVVALRSSIRLPRGVPGTLQGIANLTIPGKGTGRVACDLYRWAPSPDARREVVLFMDTSGSMADKINGAQICAAGVARSALKRGYRVTVFNFSDFAYFQQATREPRKLHRIIAVNIGGFTALPRIEARHLPPSGVPRDFVIVSDGLFNKHVKGSVASHRKAFRSSKANRAFFYLFGNPRLKLYRHPLSVYARLRRVGYHTRSMLKIRRSKAVADKPIPNRPIPKATR